MSSQQKKHRRSSLLLITLIAFVLLIACATVPLMIAFLVGLIAGSLISILTIVYWLLK